MLKTEQIEKLKELDKPILTFKGEDGYPVSVPVEAEVVSLNGKTGTKMKLEKLPDLANQLKDGKDVNLLYNHIAPLEMGGYGDRRYLQVYGVFEDSEIEITNVKGWDENEVDFLSLLQRSIPTGKEYMAEYNKELYEKAIQENSEALLITAVDGNSQTQEVSYIKDEDNTMYFFGQFPDPIVRQLDISPEVRLRLKAPKGYNYPAVEVKAKASFVKNKGKQAELTDRLAEVYPGIHTALVQLKVTSRFIKLVPFKMEYGAKSAVELYEDKQKTPSIYSQMKTAVSTRVKYWFYGARVPFFTAAVIPVLVGSAAAFFAQNGQSSWSFNWGYFGLTMLGMLLVHAGANIVNDFFDHTTKNDDVNTLFTPVNGGSRFIQSDIAKPSKIIMTSFILLLAGALVGVYINSLVEGNAILYLGIAGGFLALFYSAWPLKLAYRGVGDISIAIAFGLIPVLGAFYVQTETLSWDVSKYAIAASVPVGILVALILYINSYQDYDADKMANKRTSIVRLGKKRATQLFAILIYFQYIWVVIAIAAAILPWPTIIVMLTLPLGIKVVKQTKQFQSKIYELLSSNFGVIGIHLLVGLLLTIGLIISAFLPDALRAVLY